jgi:hypothetical protein
MKLLATVQEVDELIAENFVRPSMENEDEFTLKITSLSGATRNITVVVDSSTQISTSKIATPITTVEEIGHDSVEEWIMSWRSMWRGKRAKAMGSREKCIKNMKEFFQLFPTYSKEHVFKARDRYFNSLNGDMTYLEQADYFIKKRVPNGEGGTETRRTLLTYCEEVILDEEFGIEKDFSAYDDV